MLTGAPWNSSPIFASASVTVVVQNAGRRRPLDAGDSAEIFVDSRKIMVSHVLKGGPWHDLQKGAVEREREAFGANGAWWAYTARMQVITVNASPHDLIELGERVAPFGQPGFVRCQITADNVWRRWRPERAEVTAAPQVGRCVDRLLPAERPRRDVE